MRPVPRCAVSRTTWPAVLALVWLGSPGFAQPAPGSWEFTLTPYALAAGVSGDLSVGERSRSFDVSAGELFSSLDFAFMLNLEARKGRWAAGGDLFYADLGKQTDAVSPGPGPGLGPFTVDLQQLIVAGDLGFEVVRGLDVLAGARGVRAPATLKGRRGVIAESDPGWVDPFVGLRYRGELGERWRARLRGDVGGFGVGSEISLFASAALSYRATDWLSLAVGYRLWRFDREGEGEEREFDATVSGFGGGLSFEF